MQQKSENEYSIRIGAWKRGLTLGVILGTILAIAVAITVYRIMDARLADEAKATNYYYWQSKV